MSGPESVAAPTTFDEGLVNTAYAVAKERAEREGNEVGGLVEIAQKLALVEEQLEQACTNVNRQAQQLLEAQKFAAGIRAHRDVWAARLRRRLP